MNKTLLHTDIQEFINTNLNNNISKLLFKGSPFSGISIQELVEQIESKNKAEKKLPTWFNTQNIYYPNKRNIEQTSSEITARYKAALVSGNTLIDLTGGFGVDAYYFSRAFQEVIHCEKNEQLSEIVHYNLKLLNANNIITVASDGLSYLEKQQKHIDCIYIDPSRRDD
ncbi:MAG: RsmD family RNA methyltransferase, partial [Flavobacteriaceae bacterium]|nr:RsmD family RNA methyltransferase [Flavobacteriaceae bacterium]